MTPILLQSLCREISRFGARENFTFKVLPVIAWEFTDITAFVAALTELERTILEMCPYLSAAEITRRPNSHTIELDCHAVTFRLICQQMLDTPEGPIGIADVKFERRNSPTFDFAALNRLRKSGGGY